jgi:gluconokinase
MPNVPGLRSPYEKIGRLVYFGRMLDKIRLHSLGRLPADYIDNLGDSKPGMFDARCCGFLRLSYADIKRRTLEGGSDEEVLEWAEKRGARRSDDECAVWNAFMMKRGWRDAPEVVQRLHRRVAEGGFGDKPIETYFDFIDYDEGRDPVSAKAWEKAC